MAHDLSAIFGVQGEAVCHPSCNDDLLKQTSIHRYNIAHSTQERAKALTQIWPCVFMTILIISHNALSVPYPIRVIFCLTYSEDFHWNGGA